MHKIKFIRMDNLPPMPKNYIILNFEGYYLSMDEKYYWQDYKI